MKHMKLLQAASLISSRTLKLWLFVFLQCNGLAVANDQLLSWRDTAHKKAIVEYVERVTKTDSPDFIPVAERIAVFDNDGTLWSEQPIYVQLFFMIEHDG